MSPDKRIGSSGRGGGGGSLVTGMTPGGRTGSGLATGAWLPAVRTGVSHPLHPPIRRAKEVPVIAAARLSQAIEEW